MGDRRNAAHRGRSSVVSDMKGIRDMKKWDISFWFAVLSPIIGVLIAFLAIRLL